MDQRGSGGQKRARGNDRSAAAQNEGDWTCPQCGNVNFAFRTTCNLQNCGAPKPSQSTQKGGPVNPLAYEQVPSAMYMGVPSAIQSVPVGMPASYGVPMGVPSAAGIPYDYNNPNVILPYNTFTLQPAYGPPGGGGYGMGPVVDGGYGMGFSMGRGIMMAGMGNGSYMEENGPRKRRGPVGKLEDDWICPKCGNSNFSFRASCNMRKCNAPKPATLTQGKSSTSGMPPDGCWTCNQCGNVNYPFRTKCNRRSCGAEKPDDIQALAKSSSQD